MTILTKLNKWLLAIGLMMIGTSPACSDVDTEARRMLTIPTKVYKTPSNAKEKIEGWVFFLIVESKKQGDAVPAGLTLTYFSKGNRVRGETMGAAELRTIDKTDYPPARLTGSAPADPTFWPHAFRLHSYVPAALEIDSMEAELRIGVGDNVELVKTTIPIAAYAQKVRLIFPFKGKGLVTQGGVLEGGHRNRSGLYALDALGLTDTYAPMRKAKSKVQDYAGWGREIISPGAGKIVSMRNDRPDQPVDGVSDPKYFAPEYASGGDTGNSVVIDHGAGEFSLIAHLQRGSVRVKVGDAVTPGQVIGLLGNSGDTSGPHMHYQLQNGPRWEYSDGLPATFENVSSTARGTYFDSE